jgi:hypothetical protein
VPIYALQQPIRANLGRRNESGKPTQAPRKPSRFGRFCFDGNARLDRVVVFYERMFIRYLRKVKAREWSVNRGRWLRLRLWAQRVALGPHPLSDSEMGALSSRHPRWQESRLQRFVRRPAGVRLEVDPAREAGYRASWRTRCLEGGIFVERGIGSPLLCSARTPRPGGKGPLFAVSSGVSWRAKIAGRGGKRQNEARGERTRTTS